MNEESETPSYPIEDLKEKYKGRWIAIIVTERDENGQPLKGQILSFSSDRYLLRDKVASEGDVCIFYTGRVPWEGYEVIV